MKKNKIELRNRFLDSLENPLSKMEGTFNFDIASATGYLLEDLYNLLEFWSKQTFIDTATEDEFIDKHAQLFGVTRRFGTKAKGEIKITGKANTLIAAGAIVLNREGVKYKTLLDVLLNSAGLGKTEVECLQSGNIGNCAIGEITSFEISNTDVYTVINETAIIGGYDKEPNSSLIARAKERVTKPAHSGNVNDYIQWAKQVDGVGRVLVKPLWNGNGTVKVFVANYNNEIADSLLVENVKQRIERADGRPVGADVTVVSFNNKNINVKATVILKNSFSLSEMTDKIQATIKIIVKNGEATYLKNGQSLLSINRIEKAVLELEGIIDCFVKINNSSENIVIAEEEIVNITEVVVDEQ